MTLYVPAIAVVAVALTVGFCWVLVKEAGPLQLQVTGIVLLVDAVNVNALPVQTGVLDDGVGVAGVWFTITFIVPAGDVQPLMVTVTLYVPVANVDALVMLGFCSVLVNEFGPFQLHVCVPVEVVDALRFRVLPLHKGLTFGMVGVAGGVGSTKLNGPTDAEGQFDNTTNTLEYVPAGSDCIVITPLALLVIVDV